MTDTAVPGTTSAALEQAAREQDLGDRPWARTRFDIVLAPQA